MQDDSMSILWKMGHVASYCFKLHDLIVGKGNVNQFKFYDY